MKNGQAVSVKPLSPNAKEPMSARCSPLAPAYSIEESMTGFQAWKAQTDLALKLRPTTGTPMPQRGRNNVG